MNARNDDDNDDNDTVVCIIAVTIGRRRRCTGLEYGQSIAFSPTRCEIQSAVVGVFVGWFGVLVGGQIMMMMIKGKI
jgi:hypothetical protein